MEGVCKLSCDDGWVNINDICVKCGQYPICLRCSQYDINICDLCNENYCLNFSDKKCKGCGEKQYQIDYPSQPIKKVCFDCPNYCKKCDKYGCIECDINLNNNTKYKSYKRTCYINCPDRTYEKNYKCIDCPIYRCIECENYNKCKKCESGLFLHYGECVDRCPEKYIPDDNKMCISCNDPYCRNCSPKNICISCINPYVLYENICKDKCPEGYSSRDRICKKCKVEFCKICTYDQEVCYECKYDFYLQNNSCIKTPEQCPANQFSCNRGCCDCPIHCKRCSNYYDCLECDNGYNFDLNRYCKKITDPTCLDPNCLSCAADQKICYYCKKRFYLYNGICNVECPLNTIRDEFNGKCIDCDFKCATCKGYPYPCSTCNSPYKYFDNRCLDNCPYGTVEINGRCTQCDDYKCQNCDSNLIKCPKCFYPYYRDDDVCVNRCPRNKYSVEMVCQYCDKEKCEFCNYDGTCRTCKEDYFLYKQSCKKICPDKTCTEMGNCYDCYNPKCRTCSSDLIKCKTCFENLFVIKDDCVECGKGYYIDNNNCLPCSDDCSICTSIDNCTECKISDAIWDDVLKRCHIRTDPPPPVKCDKMIQYCSMCRQKNNLICEQCVRGYFLYNDRCYKICPDRTYENGTICSNCDYGCKKCNKNECIDCDDSFYKYKKQCTRCDRFNDVIVPPDCKRCNVENCDICKQGNPDQCEPPGCRYPYKYNDGKCQSECKIGSYSKGNECLPCPKNCLSCYSERFCIKCIANMFLDNGTCGPCQPPKRANSKGECVNCSDPYCEICNIENPFICEHCREETNTFLDDNQCRLFCSNNKYADKRDRKCKVCMENCQECYSSKWCKRCFPDYKIENKLCVRNCSERYYLNRNIQIPTCTRCPKNCIRCTSKECDVCKSPFALNDMNKRCVFKCPYKYFKEKQSDGTYKCIECKLGCRICTSRDKCITCDYGYLWDQYKSLCVRKCDDTFISYKGSCVLCSAENCFKCIDEDPTYCNLCQQNYFAYNGICEPKCPDGTFLKITENFNYCYGNY